MQHLHLSLIYHIYYFVHGLSCIYPRTYLLILLPFFLAICCTIFFYTPQDCPLMMYGSPSVILFENG